MAEQQMRIRMSEQTALGVFADFIRAWHTNDSFVLDFVALNEPVHADEDDGSMIIDGSVTARVRIPPGQVFELMKALEQQLSAWEREHPDKKL
ncbi:MAG: DUF3467 domain-containing protein [Propionibacteriaceae bacterium]|jgi:hypothetical protein|nr:DUF3467 domain-containing protein [Propionibacteriaceae bacterium]